MTVNKLVVNGQFINSLSQAVAAGSSNLNDIPQLVRTVIQDEMYKHYIVEMLNKEVQFDNFEQFVEAKSPIGLGTDIPTLKEFCQKDNTLLQLITNEVLKVHTHGGVRNQTGKNQHTKKIVVETQREVKFDNIKLDLPEEIVDEQKIESVVSKPRKAKPPTGTSKEYAIRKLEKDHPELLKSVLDGEKTANAAMIEAGVRKKQFSVFAGDPPSAAKTLVKYYGSEGTKELIEELKKLINE